MNFKSELESVRKKLSELENAARGLKNQNLADLLGHASGRLAMAAQHHDVDNVGRDEARQPEPGAENSGGSVAFALNDPGRVLQDQEAARRATLANQAAAPFPGAGPSAGEPVTNSDPNAHHPGDPIFNQENKNPGFQDPNNVDLNSDGTLKRAPNSVAGVDERDKG